MSKILKNTTVGDIEIQDMGITIPASTSYVITKTEAPMWSESLDVISFITSGDIVVNDGSSDLSINDGIRFLEYPDRHYVENSSVSVKKVTTTVNYRNNITATDGGDGLVHIDAANEGEGIDDRLVHVKCVPGESHCIQKVHLLVDSDPCFIKKGVC